MKIKQKQAQRPENKKRSMFDGAATVKGVEKCADGSLYQGDLLHGNGTLTYENGDAYEGEWQQGKKHGSGAWKTTKGINYYGEWKNNKMEGYGVLSDPKGEKYQGFFKNNQKSGKGVLKYANGDIYKGYFEMGEFHGFGQYFWANGNSYRGEFKRGKSDGPGVLRYKHPKEKVYQGYFRQNMKWGYGVYTWESGGCYKGFFQKDAKNGYGEMFWRDGNIYRGWWKDGVQHGKGELFVVDQGLMKGVFNKNRLAVLTQHKVISRQQYENSFSNPQKNLPHGLTRKHRLSKKKGRRNQLHPTISSPQRRPKMNKSLMRGSLDTIQFPLLFHHHSRLKTQNHQATRELKFNRHRSSKILSLQLGNERQKNMHSALGIHRSYIQSYKHSDSTMAENTIKQRFSIFNSQLKYPKF